MSLSRKYPEFGLWDPISTEPIELDGFLETLTFSENSKSKKERLVELVDPYTSPEHLFLNQSRLSESAKSAITPRSRQNPSLHDPLTSVFIKILNRQTKSTNHPPNYREKVWATLSDAECGKTQWMKHRCIHVDTKEQVTRKRKSCPNVKNNKRKKNCKSSIDRLEVVL